MMSKLSRGKGSVTKYQSRGVFRVSPEPIRTKNEDEKKSRSKPVSLLPDAIATEDDGITWIEVDTSARGSARMARLLGLLKATGRTLKDIAGAHSIPIEQAALKRISIHFSELAYLHYVRARLMDLVSTTKDTVLTESSNNFRLNHIGDDIFEVYRAGDIPTGQADFCMGHVILQMLPTGLPAFKSDKPDKSRYVHWFETNHLPYRRPASLEAWRTPVSTLK